MDNAPIVSPRKYAPGERAYREQKRLKQREERAERERTFQRICGWLDDKPAPQKGA